MAVIHGQLALTSEIRLPHIQILRDLPEGWNNGLATIKGRILGQNRDSSAIYRQNKVFNQ